MPVFGIVPKNFCKDCNWYNPTKQATCTKQAYLSQDPVMGEPVWVNLRVCVQIIVWVAAGWTALTTWRNNDTHRSYRHPETLGRMACSTKPVDSGLN